MHDEQHISNLLHAYVEAVDQRDFEALGDLFQRASFQFVMPGQAPGRILRGKDDIQRFHRKILGPIEDGTVGRHIISNLIVEVADNGETATSRCYSCGLRFRKGSPPVVVGVARYFGQYRKLDGAWHLAGIVNQLDLLG
ncbi:MAG: nuclear transport factor 2 family protein [Gammaproteobacteria bacterium]